jgi:outer membrane protein
MKMKKIIILSFLAILSFSAIAQSKFGHINAQEVLLLMPESKAAEKILIEEQESVKIALKSMYAEKDAIEQDFSQNEATLTDLEKQDVQAKFQSLVERIQLYERTAQQKLETKNQELMEPIQTKLFDAINKVAKEGGYTYIFSDAVFLYADEKNDVTALVKKELGL